MLLLLSSPIKKGRHWSFERLSSWAKVTQVGRLTPEHGPSTASHRQYWHILWRSSHREVSIIWIPLVRAEIHLSSHSVKSLKLFEKLLLAKWWRDHKPYQLSEVLRSHTFLRFHFLWKKENDLYCTLLLNFDLGVKRCLSLWRRAGPFHLSFPEGLAIWSHFCDKLTKGQRMSAKGSKTRDRKKKVCSPVETVKYTACPERVRPRRPGVSSSSIQHLYTRTGQNLVNEAGTQTGDKIFKLWKLQVTASDSNKKWGYAILHLLQGLLTSWWRKTRLGVGVHSAPVCSQVTETRTAESQEGVWK